MQKNETSISNICTGRHIKQQATALPKKYVIVPRHRAAAQKTMQFFTEAARYHRVTAPQRGSLICGTASPRTK